MRSIGLCLLLPLVWLLSVAAQGEALDSQYRGLRLNANLIATLSQLLDIIVQAVLQVAHESTSFSSRRNVCSTRGM